MLYFLLVSEAHSFNQGTNPFSERPPLSGTPPFLKICWIRGYYEIGVHFFEKIKVIVKKGNCANNFQYRLNFSKKKLKSKLLSGRQFFSAQVI